MLVSQTDLPFEGKHGAQFRGVRFESGQISQDQSQREAGD